MMPVVHAQVAAITLAFLAQFEADNRGIGCFLRGDVFASGFAELFGSLGDVENIVDNLERETDVDGAAPLLLELLA